MILLLQQVSFMSSLLLFNIQTTNSFPSKTLTFKPNPFPPKLIFKATRTPTVVNQQLNLSITNESIITDTSLTLDTQNEIIHLLSTVADVLDIKKIHARIVKAGLLVNDSLIGNKLVVSYAKAMVDDGDDCIFLLREVNNVLVSSYATVIGSCSRNRRWGDVLYVFGSMVHEGLMPDKFMLPRIVKACSEVNYLRIGRVVHGFSVKRKLEVDLFVGNAFIDMYGNCGDLRSSRAIFDCMKKRDVVDVVSWTSMVSSYMDAGDLDEARNVYELMKLNEVKLDLISWNTLVSGFARNGEVNEALRLLDEMEEEGVKPGISSWNGVISGCVQNGYYEDALDIYGKMLWSSIDPNAMTNASVLSASSGVQNLNVGRAIHARTIKCEDLRDIYVEGSLINMYAKCGRIDFAEKVFMKMEKKNTVIWSQMITTYVNEGKMSEAKRLLQFSKDNGLKLNVVPYNTVLGGYARNGQKEEAYLLLEEMFQIGLIPNHKSVNVLITGFHQSAQSGDALKLFRVMQSPLNTVVCNYTMSQTNFPDKVLNVQFKPDSVTTTSALAACADLNLLCHGKEIHAYAVRNGFESNMYVSGALVDMYAKCNDIYSAAKVFYQIQEKNTITWSILMAGLVNNRKPEEALKLFPKMLWDALIPDSVTLAILLSVCSSLSNLKLGRVLHGFIMKYGSTVLTVTLETSLIDMYAKCGSIIEARHVFESVLGKDIAVYNAMMNGYALHRRTSDAFELFEQLKGLELRPDDITFTALLSACTHEGLVEKGCKYFNSMESSYGIKPSLEHYSCVVGIMGTAGLLKEALEFIRRSPYAPDACMWSSLLKACRLHSNPEIGEKAAKALFDFEPNNALNYITLSNIYTATGMWDSVMRVRDIMRSRGLMAITEWSSIDVNNKIYRFKGGERSHPELEVILMKWGKFAAEMEQEGLRPLHPLFNDEQTLDLFSCLHTEKLAVCFGIISSSAHRPIHISKNLRMCVDCHTSLKCISKIDQREVFVKDVSLYHHFKNGICSCQDKW